VNCPNQEMKQGIWR